MFFGNKKCRIYAAFGVSQTPKYKIYIERKKNMLENTYTLENGIKIPKLGLGTWFIDDSKVAEAVREAVKIGYRMIDTAQAYGNEVICCEV